MFYDYIINNDKTIVGKYLNSNGYAHEIPKPNDYLIEITMNIFERKKSYNEIEDKYKRKCLSVMQSNTFVQHIVCFMTSLIMYLSDTPTFWIELWEIINKLLEKNISLQKNNESYKNESFYYEIEKEMFEITKKILENKRLYNK